MALHGMALNKTNQHKGNSKNLLPWQQPLGWQQQTTEGGHICTTTRETGCIPGNPWRRKPFLLRAQSTLASVLSLSSNSSTSVTFVPPALAGGSSTFNTCNRGAKSTPKESALMTSIGFFLGLHEIWQRGIPWFIQAQVRRNDRRQWHAHFLDTSIHLSCNCNHRLGVI